MNVVTGLLDDWVCNHPWAGAGYVDGGHPREEVLANRKHGNDGVNAIQQVRQEILEFIEVILNVCGDGSALEIGLGEAGGTHYIWSLLFDQVYTIEVRQEVVNRYLDNQTLDSEQSTFLVAPSFRRDVLLKAARSLKGGCDFLFIDGDHERDGVEGDWRMYSHLVRKGGIVAFHDTICDHPGEREVSAFVKDLECGKITGEPIKFNHIHHSLYVGISYYIV